MSTTPRRNPAWKPDPRTQSIIEVMHVLSSRDGWAILASIAFEAKDCSSIAEELGLCKSQISKHLGRMRDCGLAEICPRDGHRQPYRARPECVSRNGNAMVEVKLTDGKGGRLHIARPVEGLYGSHGWGD
jgi:predicted transcriptional regulator